MRILVLKLTSMGDVIHVLPALSDAKKAIPNLVVDFVVEEPFAEIPTWHSTVRNVIPVATRKWRKNLWSSKADICRCFRQLRNEKYDMVIDAQGLGKSAFISLLTKGSTHGYNKYSIRESFASTFYRNKYAVDMNKHAIDRIRILFSHALQYQYDESIVDYGIRHASFTEVKHKPTSSYAMLFHGTTWLAKEWPEENWHGLAQELSNQGLMVLIPWGNERERLRAEKIAENIPSVIVLEKMTLSQLAYLLNGSQYAVAVDTGLGHLAAALSVPTVSIYGPTNTSLIGTKGENQIQIGDAIESFDSSKKNKPYDYGKVTVEVVLSHLETIDS